MSYVVNTVQRIENFHLIICNIVKFIILYINNSHNRIATVDSIALRDFDILLLFLGLGYLG